VLIRHLWQLKTVVFMHWCLICVVLLADPVLDVSLVFVHILKTHKTERTQQLNIAREEINTYFESMVFLKFSSRLLFHMKAGLVFS
jgi:hypothetical protein